jgi:competence protein ComEA
MLKKILTLTALLFSLSSFAGVDINKASAAELDGIKGIGPSLSGKILKERNKGNFKDWPDLMQRVSGMGEKSSANFSAQGLTVNGSGYQGGSTTAPAKAAQPEKPKSGKS